MDKDTLRFEALTSALRIAAIYFIVGCLWILLSDWAVETLFVSPHLAARTQTYKGWFYVLVTAALVFHLVHRLMIHQSRVQFELFEKEQRLSQALAAGNMHPWTLDVDRDAFSADRKFLAELGYLPEDIPYLQKQWKALIHKKDLPAVLDEINSHLQDDKQGIFMQCRIRRKDGTYAWVQVLGKVIERDSFGNAVSMAGTLNDVTYMRKRDDNVRSQTRGESRNNGHMDS